MNSKQFYELHQQPYPLVLCNVWDVASASVAENLGFKAIGTSSAAIASSLGYEDGEQLSFDELLYIVKRITSVCDLPLTVDIESGYSEDPLITSQFIKALYQLGVVGINIEDSKVDGQRNLTDANHFAGYLSAIKGQLIKDKVNIFINVRTDTFLLAIDNALAETKKRARLYESAGADGLFVPCLNQVKDIEALTCFTELPLNVMCIPDLPDFNLLEKLNVKRISMGNFIFNNIQTVFERSLADIIQDKSFESIF